MENYKKKPYASMKMLTFAKNPVYFFKEMCPHCVHKLYVYTIQVQNMHNTRCLNFLTIQQHNAFEIML